MIFNLKISYFQNKLFEILFENCQSLIFMVFMVRLYGSMHFLASESFEFVAPLISDGSPTGNVHYSTVQLGNNGTMAYFHL